MARLPLDEPDLGVSNCGGNHGDSGAVERSNRGLSTPLPRVAARGGSRRPWCLLAVFAVSGLYFTITGLSTTTTSLGERHAPRSTIDEPVSAFDLEVGDCVVDIGIDDEVVDFVQLVTCTEDDQFEVYHAFSLADGTYPGGDTIAGEANAQCLTAFDNLVGRAWEESIFDFQTFFPSRESWELDGDREVLCLLYRFDGMLKDSSAAGTGL